MRVRAGKAVLLVEDLGDIKMREEPVKKHRVTRKEKLELIRKANERAQRDLIRGLLAVPMERRTHFLRRLVGPGGSSCL